MTESDAQLGKAVRSAFGSPMSLFVLSLAAIVVTFGLANSTIAFETKTRFFAAIVVAYILFCIVSFVGRSGNALWNVEGFDNANLDLDRKLSLLEDAANFFAGTLRTSDTMRLIAAKLREIVPFDDCVLLKVDLIEGRFRAVHSDGNMAPMLRNSEFGLGVGLAGRAFRSQMVEAVQGRVATDETYHSLAMESSRASVAVPLVSRGEVVAVLQLFARDQNAFGKDQRDLLEAVANRIEPLVSGSMSYEASVDNALTDPTTELPNERAFFLVLENQIAETQRKPEDRQVSVLSVDVKCFADVNTRFGHATGDRLLNFVADKIKSQLRQMDFIARTRDDEFLIALPTADHDTATEIIDRLRTEFFDCRFRANDSQTTDVDLNYGHSSFGSDGESAKTIVASARERREQSKLSVRGSVVWFPKEYVN
ncbi:MAG TPA: sensor domain-containing diguanylate cyclase [Pyrinomonadaceae bacterium]|nr:sensor domain-containing diguanylate cyclase [Pyrinomonadaceae bacterium]